MSFEIRKASRQGVKPLVGFYGKSGSGKTMSALLFARGLVGESGRIILCDSESGRGSLFADIIPGGYSVLDIEPPFSPERYQEAFETAEAHADCVVIDSLSHEHSGEGGVLDMQESELERMAGDNWQKREACKMASWIKPKLAHKQMIQRILRCKTALICCLRGEEKTHMAKGADGKNKVITDEFSSPIFDQRFIFELLLNLETVARDGKGGFVIPRKITHPSIASLLPSADEQIGVAHGESLARWCAAPGTVPPPVSSQAAAPPPSTAPGAEMKALKSKLWHATVSIHKGDQKALSQWLWDEAILADTEHLSEIDSKRMAEVLEKVTEKLKVKGTA